MIHCLGIATIEIVFDEVELNVADGKDGEEDCGNSDLVYTANH